MVQKKEQWGTLKKRCECTILASKEENVSVDRIREQILFKNDKCFSYTGNIIKFSVWGVYICLNISLLGSCIFCRQKVCMCETLLNYFIP